MKHFLSLAVCVSLFCASSVRAEEEWIELFNGKDLTGWIQKNGTATYEVKDGAIVGTTADGSPNSFLCTEERYGDFELQFEVKIDKELNSGVQIRSKTKGEEDHRPGQPHGRVNGPQVEIEVPGGVSGYIYGEATGRGWLTPDDRRERHEHFKTDQWNEYRVVAEGPKIKVWINGEEIDELDDEQAYHTHPVGFIGLQVHGIPRDKGPYTARWRNLKLKKIER
ncbi:MAG: DUF1080 domain-containing protein [Pirellulaceae bacterium]